MGPDAPVKSAMRVLTLLELLGGDGREMQHAEIAAALDIPKSSLTQLLKTLTGQGWLSYASPSKGYSLGPKTLSLVSRQIQEADLVGAAEPVIAALAVATGETAALNLRKGDDHEVATTRLSEHRLLSVMRAGDRAPLYATSGGKAILAAWPIDQLDAYLARVSLQPITPATHRSTTALKDELAQVREQGWAISREEYTPGVIGLARPLLTSGARGMAAVSVAMPATRFSEAVRISALRHLAKAVAAIARGAPRKTPP